MAILVTGAAGFIGFHTALALLDAGHEVIGIDSLNSYYDVGLKKDRLAQLQARSNFAFHHMNIADRQAVDDLRGEFSDVTGIIHLAAQAGVRYSMIDPYSYVESNLMGQVVMLELARQLPQLKHFVYASSSSVYGNNTKLPFAIEDNVDQPISLYAATKRADELITQTYCHIYRIPATGLRFFTVYGPWGRPDMAVWSFTQAILEGKPIQVFNGGHVQRDFTYIDDVVAGTLGALNRPPLSNGADTPPHQIYNLGNNRAEPLEKVISIIERETGKGAIREPRPIPAGDVATTFADIEASKRDLGFIPRISLDEGITRFVAWYRDYKISTLDLL